MNKKTIITALLAAVLALTSCHQSAQKAEAEQQADSFETVTNADTLRLVVKDKELTASPSVVTAISSS
jgi:PBP1b-binding outer membrane lipoprotein LpoB